MRSKTQIKNERRLRRHRRVRKKVFGTPVRPRLVVHRSSKNIEGQVVNDLEERVLVGASTRAPELDKVRGKKDTTKTDLSRAAGKLLAERAVEAGVKKVVFDRGGYPYHGRIAAFADGARDGGLEF